VFTSTKSNIGSVLASADLQLAYTTVHEFQTERALTLKAFADNADEDGDKMLRMCVGLLLATLACWCVYDGMTLLLMLMLVLVLPSMSVERRRTAAALGGGGRAGRDGDAVDMSPAHSTFYYVDATVLNTSSHTTYCITSHHGLECTVPV